MGALSIAHDTLDPNYRPDIKSITHLGKLDGNRRNPSGNFTDSYFHFYCVRCGHKSVDYDATLLHESTNCNASITQDDFSCTHCNVYLDTKEECKIHLSTFCRYTAGKQCPVCGAKSTDTTNICMCGANANLYWDSIRDYICKKTNKLMRVEHLSIVRALIHLHFLTAIDFAETGSVRDYSAEAGTAAFAKEDPMTLEDVEVVINALPTIKKEGYIFLPGTEQTWAIADIVNLWNKSILSHERDPDSSSASCTSKNEQEANMTCKEQWDSFLQYTDETANPAAVLAAYNGLPKRGKMELLDNAVGNNTLMGYLIEASIVVDLEDLFNKLNMLKSGTIEESDTDSTQNETNDTAELSLVKEINKDKENRRTPQEFGSELFGGDEENEEEDTSGGRKNEEDDEDSQYMGLQFQKSRVEVEQHVPRTQHTVGHPQIGKQHNEDNEEEQGVEKTKDTTENNNESNNNNTEANNNNTEEREIEGTRKRTYHHPNDAYTIDQTKDKDEEDTLENTTDNEEKLRDAAELDANLRRKLGYEKEVDNSIQKETEERRRRETNRAKKEEDERRKEATRAAELQKTQEEEANELAKTQEAAHRTQREKEKKAEEDRITRIADLQKELEFEIERQAELEEESRKLDALEEEEKRIEEAQKLQKEEEERLQKEAHRLQKLQKETQRLRKEEKERLRKKEEEEVRKRTSEAQREKEEREREERQKREKEWRKKKEGMEAKLNADITKLRKQNKESELKMKERKDDHTKNEEQKSKQEFFRKQQEEEDANECIRKAFAGFFTKEVKKALKEKEKRKKKK